MFSISIISLVITVVVNILLAFFVYLKSRNKRANIIFSFLALGVALWALTNIATQLVTTEQAGIIWAGLSNFSAVILAFFFVLFTLVFPDEKIKKKNIWSLIFILTFGITITLWPRFLISRVELNPWHMEFTKFIALFTAWFLGMMVFGFYTIIRKYRIYTGQIKAQLRFILLGTSISTILGVLLNLGLPLSGRYELVWLGPNFSLIMVAFIAYAIIVFRLMNIKMVVRRYSVRAASLVVILTIAFLFNNIISNFLPHVNKFIDFSILFIGVLLYPATQNYFFYIANKYFFSSLYDTREVIGRLSEKLSSTLIVDKIYNHIADAIVGSLCVNLINIYIFNNKLRKYEIKYSYGDISKELKSFIENQGFCANYLNKKKAVIINEIKKVDYDKHKKIIDLLRNQKIAVLVPLSVKSRIIGILALSDKETREVYNDEDIQLLEIIGDQSAIAIENALNYEEIKNFSKKLEREVDLATEKLIRANSKLRQLDEAKSEFVSIASHQLRTPLTVIKGYLAMIIEGSYGRANKLQRESLGKVFESNERLIQLVENLLNISRLESGRLNFYFEDTQLDDLIKKAVKSQVLIAKKRGLKLIYHKSKKHLPIVSIDKEKIRQIILNIVDNAIKYGVAGEIIISVKKEKNNLLVKVSDQGIGIEPDDLPDMFDKFTRGSGTPLIDTEGTGLGLYVAKRLVQAHGGRIWAESKGKDKGTTLYFTIPIKKE